MLKAFQSLRDELSGMSTPLGGGHIIFAFSAVHCPDAWVPLI